VDGLKHVLVGELDRYQFYNPRGSGDEADFNFMINPDPSFRSFLDDVVAGMSRDGGIDIGRCVRMRCFNC
jgi:hypothetical protein